MKNSILIPEQGLESAWQSPSNIALIKYWGKHGHQLPRNASLSITLNNSITRTRVKISPSNDEVEGLKLNFKFGGESNPAFAAKTEAFLNSLAVQFPFLSNCFIEIETDNSFPHSAGIASSASAMSALALCLCDIDNQLSQRKENWSAFLLRASNIARLGSGSAARSVFGGFSVWGKHPDIKGSSDEYAVPLPLLPHAIFNKIRNSIFIVDATAKKVSSSVGHNLMNGHPFAEARFEQAKKNLSGMFNVLISGDWSEFTRITENEAMSLHAMMMSSSPGYMLMHPNTLVIIDKMKQFREQSGVKVCFTLDAGPNVHLLYPESEAETIKPLLSEIQEICINKAFIDDKIGNGPENLNYSNDEE
ncbi:MAG: diphosphomevalonate decarboxylase [Bacteroidetes bacterium HGW-Bacteroidetes-11]|jgi:diphosphomevalonate decarboxylase|nr:MAG: diphosphomevalonate decarboxylase [Bacteroidetes bacterium HGW-Bacteroidetes-11]